jgi:hypothetical protein
MAGGMEKPSNGNEIVPVPACTIRRNNELAAPVVGFNVHRTNLVHAVHLFRQAAH